MIICLLNIGVIIAYIIGYFVGYIRDQKRGKEYLKKLQDFQELEKMTLEMTMSRDKQTEIPESEMGMSGYSKFSWKLWEAGICNMSEAQKANQIMLEQGYRKADEVAREIFDAVDEMMACVAEMTGCAITYYGKYAELKKKYTESEGTE